ncbi:uncharacterized protein B0I36DRAFT_357449 [Microdochium trichocladiopsis]|uniref:Uncharacterized protein n=1 Tax=Microdochium trichocladiopsis TaxID=1682393 RepID=A0A9P8YHH9_9PEZI|nr:uncharacterized protein B0I36DRAFT_357449 [Microdochium trichocladiopsis]KAH7040102.1 hypothetical protein B0I36DRAFT_357449 [Microdochium trichocladiopsis]
MEPPPTPGGSAAQDIFSVFEQGFDEEEEEDDLPRHEWPTRSPVLPDLLPSPDFPDTSPSKVWGRSTWPSNDWSSPKPAGASSPGIDPRDALVHRLNGLISRIGSDSVVDGAGISTLHNMVDRMEHTLVENSRPGTRESQPLSSPGFDRPWGSGVGSAEGAHTAPARRRQQHKRRNHVTAEIREQRIAQEAREISAQMEAVARSLQERQEETEHIHAMLLTRLEQAADKIVRLETRVVELEGERDEAEMDILNLQIHMKAIEVQMPKNIDAELRESISTWKAEWSALKRKRSLRRTSSHVHNSSSHTPSAPTPRRTMTSPG